MTKMSEAAVAQATATVVAKYTAKAWHAVPEGTTDRAVSSAAHKRLLTFVPDYKKAKFVWLNTHATWTAALPVFEWMEDEPGSNRKTGHVQAIPKKSFTPDDKDVVFIITGTVTQDIATARLWLGTTDLSAHWISGQHHQTVAAYAEFATEYAKVSLGKDEPLVRAVSHHCASTGCNLTYKGVHFVGDFAVGHLANGDEVTPLWCDKRAAELGATKQEDGTWA